MIVLLKYPLHADYFPIKVNCKNNVCDCNKLTDTTTLNIDSFIDSINEGLIKDSALIACSYHQIALEYFYKFDDLSSLKYNNRAREIRSVYNDGLLWRSNLNIGFNYYDLNEYKQASLHFKKALSLPGEKEALDSMTIFRNLAECYLEISDFETAIGFAKKSIQIDVDQAEKNSALNVYSRILINSKDSLNSVKAINFSVKVLNFCKSIQDYENIVGALNNLAEAHLNLENIDRAIKYFNDAIEIPNQSDTIVMAKLLSNLANAFYDKNEFNLAINTLRKSNSLLFKYYQTNYSYDYSAPYENLADNYSTLQQFDTALLHYQKALINLTNNFRTENILQNPNTKDSDLFIYSNPDMIRVLHLKATAAHQYYQQNNNRKYLTLANQTYQTAFDFHDKLQKDISTENSRLFQAKSIILFVENALNVTFKLQEKGIDVSEIAFRFMEKNKATVLLQSMNEADALQFANLPDSLLEKEKKFKIDISFYERQLNEAKLYEDTITLINELENTLFENKEKYRRLINNLEENHPDYYQLKYQQNQTQLTDIQKQLNNKTSILSYFIGDSSIYTLLVLKDSIRLFKTQKPTEWNKVINNFRDAITLSDTNAKADPYTKKLYHQYADNAYSLYQWLLKKPLKKLNHISHLTIIPDAELNYIPFDLLLKDKGDPSTVNYKKLPYLLRQKTISYAYSSTLMMEQLQNSSSKKSYTYKGYAPHYLNTIYTDIPRIRQLVNEMALLFNGKAYLKDEATKANFLKNSSSHKIVQLAMHGKLDDQNPLSSHLVFSKNTQDTLQDHHKLFASDLYNHQLNTDLAVLSACETGTGELQKGEGVMSLSRAFTYAGCPSLVMSLWSIPEKSTTDVLRNFFHNIKSCKSKDVALQQAKLDYLENTPATLTHPVYWSGLVLTGNTKPLQFKSSLSGLWWFLGLFLVLFGGYLGFKKIL